jgi:hypothetical protein
MNKSGFQFLEKKRLPAYGEKRLPVSRKKAASEI